MTEACNASCDFCTQKHNTKSKITLKRLQEIIKDFQEINPSDKYMMSFFGGEPLLEFETISKFLKDFKDDNCIRKRIITNGLLLTEEIYNFCAEYNIELRISYDGIFQDQRNYVLPKKVKKIIYNDEKIITINFGVHKNGLNLLDQYLTIMNELNLNSENMDFYFNRNYWQWSQKDIENFSEGLIRFILYVKNNNLMLPKRLLKYYRLITTDDFSAGCGAGKDFISYRSKEKVDCGVLDFNNTNVIQPEKILDLCSGCSIYNECPKTCPTMLKRAFDEGLGQNNAQCLLHKIVVYVLKKYYKGN